MRSFISHHTSVFKVYAANANVRHNVPQMASHRSPESCGSICHDVVFRQLPSLCSPRPIRRQFARVLDTGIRAAISFAVAAVLAAQPWSVDILAVPYLTAVFAIFTVQPSVGRTMQNIDTQGKGILAAVVLDVLLIAAHLAYPPSTDRIIACELLLFVSSCGLAYYFHPPLARRFGLAIHALVLIGIADGSSNSIYLPLQILLNMVIAYSLSFVLCLLPFPRLACDELSDRWQQSVLSLSDLFSDVIAAFLAVEPIAPMVLHSTAVSRLDSVNASLAIMRRLSVEAKMEADVFKIFFPFSLSATAVVHADPDRVEQLYWVVRNLLHCLLSLRYTSYHSGFLHFLRAAYSDLSLAQAEYCRLLCEEDPALVTRERVEEAQKRLDVAMEAAWAAFSEARHRVYVARGTVEETASHPPLYRADPYPLNDQQAEASMRLVIQREGEEQRNAGRSSHAPTLSASTHDVFLRSSIMFYLGRFHAAIGKMRMRDDVLSPLPPSTTGEKLTAEQMRWGRRERVIRGEFDAAIRRPWEWSIFGLHPVRDFLALGKALWGFVRRPAVDVDWMKNSVKIALIICVASLIAVIPQVSTSSALPNSVWAASAHRSDTRHCPASIHLSMAHRYGSLVLCSFTAAILTSDTEGALWQRGAHRVFGTALGGLIGYLILLAFPTNWSAHAAPHASHTALDWG